MVVAYSDPRFMRVTFGSGEACVGYEASKRHINKVFRAYDESPKWPVSGRFNVTERAIRRLQGQYPHGGLEYAIALDEEIGRIVNGAL